MIKQENIDRIAARCVAETRISPQGITEQDIYEMALCAAKEGVRHALEMVLARFMEPLFYSPCDMLRRRCDCLAIKHEIVEALTTRPL